MAKVDMHGRHFYCPKTKLEYLCVITKIIECLYCHTTRYFTMAVPERAPRGAPWIISQPHLHWKNNLFTFRAGAGEKLMKKITSLTDWLTLLHTLAKHQIRSYHSSLHNDGIPEDLLGDLRLLENIGKLAQ